MYPFESSTLCDIIAYDDYLFNFKLYWLKLDI